MTTKSESARCGDCGTELDLLCPLHAAAPEMLTLLKRLHSVVQDVRSRTDADHSPAEWDYAEDAAHALLARIEGRTIPHAGTWITPEDAKRISEDGP